MSFKMKKVIMALSVLFVVFATLTGLFVFPSYFQSSASASNSYDFQAADTIEEGVILHAWCWSFNTIKANMKSISDAGYTTIQTSPITKCYVGENGGKELYGKGKWYYHYQPVDYTIGNYQLGTEAEFASMCDEAEQYGIKIIVDAVVNHCSSNYSAISNHVKTICSQPFHTALPISDWDSRKEVTQYQLLNLWDLNTQNDSVQLMIQNYLKKCVSLGADGFRYDAALHVELPNDPASYASDFWPTILKNDSEFQYGEILSGDWDLIDSYASYMGITAALYGYRVRSFVAEHNFGSSEISDFYIANADSKKVVTWAESHDNYCNDGSYSISNKQIRMAWALLCSRDGGIPMFFSRPNGSTTSNQWGNNKIGAIGDSNFQNPEVVAGNHFHTAMSGQPEKLTNIKTRSVLMVERGCVGAMIINGTNSDITLSQKTILADGSYTDLVSGNIFLVSNGILTGTVFKQSFAAFYNDELSDGPSVYAGTLSTSKNNTFYYSTKITLGTSNTTSAYYSINGSTPVSYENMDTIHIGEDAAVGDTITLTLTGNYAQNSSVTTTYHLVKGNPSNYTKHTMVYFNTKVTKWSQVYAYVYHNDSDGNEIEATPWPGTKMTALKNGIFSFEVPASWEDAYVIFNNNAGTQIPYSRGYLIEKGDSKIYTNGRLSDYTYNSQTLPQKSRVTFNNTTDKWTSVYAYVYTMDESGTTISNASWPGTKMTKSTTYGWYFDIDYNWENCYVIFNNGTTSQHPLAGAEGCYTLAGSNYIYDGGSYVKLASSYKITYNTNGGTINQTKASTYTFGSTVTLPTKVVRSGYTFLGWYNNSSFSGTKKTSITPLDHGNKTFYARWTKVTTGTASIKKLSNPSAGQLLVAINPVAGAKGYRITYSSSSTMSSSTSKMSTMSSYAIKGLTKGKTYYVKVQAYKTDSAGNKVYGSYSVKKYLKLTK